MTGAVDRTTPEIRDLLAQTEGHAGLGPVAAALPRRSRPTCGGCAGSICIAFIGRAAADRARRLDRGGERDVLSDDRFVDNLLDMVIGAMTAPHLDGLTSWPHGE